ncbi:MAG TPA: hypothetical protein VIT20_01120 [Propionibacteriaceae bacterium]
MATEVSTRSLKIAVLVLLVVLLASIVIGLVLTRQPRLEPVPLPSVSQT